MTPIPFTSPASSTRWQAWEQFLTTLPNCIDVRTGESDGFTGKIIAIFKENSDFIEPGDSTSYIEGDDFVAVVLRIDEHWYFARYRRPVELGFLHAGIEERLAQERAEPKR